MRRVGKVPFSKQKQTKTHIKNKQTKKQTKVLYPWWSWGFLARPALEQKELG